MKAAVARARSGDGPTLIEARTYRTVGHHEGDPVVGTYRTKEEIDAWALRDPIKTFRAKIVDEHKLVSAAALDAIDARIDEQVQEAVEFARASPEPDPATAALHVYAEPLNPAVALLKAAPKSTVTTGWLDAVRDGIAEEMRRDPHILYFGEGTGERGGTFAHTKNLWAEFGAAPHGRHADLRAGLHRRRDRRLGHRRARDRRPDVRRLHLRGGRTDRAAGGQAALHVQQPDERAGRHPRRLGRRAQRRAAPQRQLSPVVGAHSRADRLPAVQRGRRQGPDEDRAARQRSRHHVRAQGFVRLQGGGAGGRPFRAVRAGAHRARGQGHHDRGGGPAGQSRA